MAFKIDNLTPFANNGKRGRVPVLYIYYNQDNDTITDAGFLPYGTFEVGDQVLVINNDYTSNAWYNVTISNKVITLVKNV